MDERDMPPCFILVDREGRWFHKGAEMIKRDIVRLFYEHIEVDSLGRYVVRLGKESCYLDVEDTPFVIQRVRFENNGDIQNFRIFLSDDTEEVLDPETLFVGEENVLYCTVKQGKFSARFHRPAYYQLAEFVQEEEGGFHLPLNGMKHFIRHKSSDKINPSPPKELSGLPMLPGLTTET
jgi:hypothetical protein